MCGVRRLGKRQRSKTHRFYGFLYPLPDDILLAWFLEAHEEMRDALRLFFWDFVSENIEAVVDLHRIGVYDHCAFCNPQCEFNGEF